VHEHTAKIAPDTEATAYASHRLALDPKHFITECLEMRLSIAPVIKNAGIRQNSTCSLQEFRKRRFPWICVPANMLMMSVEFDGSFAHL
jgi:hypothetical protein